MRIFENKLFSDSKWHTHTRIITLSKYVIRFKVLPMFVFVTEKRMYYEKINTQSSKVIFLVRTYINKNIKRFI